jgi:hypothetical protein
MATDLEQVIRELEEAVARAVASGDPAKVDAYTRALEAMKEKMLAVGEKTAKLAKNLEDATRSTSSFNLAQNRANREYNKNIKEQIEQIRNSSDSLEEYNEKIEQLAAQATSSLTSNELRTVIQQNIRNTAANSAKQAEYKKILDEVTPTLSAMGSAASTMIKNYQSGTSGIGLAAGVLEGGLNAATIAGKGLGDGMSSVGGGLLNSTRPQVRAFGAALVGSGAVIGMFSKGLSAVAQQVLPILKTELESGINSFRTMSSSGAVFAGGLTEMVDTAGKAGMTLDMLGKVVTQNKDSFAQSGLGVSGATKKFGEVSKAMGDAGFKGQLLNLGFSVEEQGGLVADTFKNMQRTGELQSATAADIATRSAEYGKNLRQISDITGKDAKAKMEAAQKDMDALDVQAKLLKMQKDQPDVYAKVQAQLSTMPDEMKAGFLQLFTGGVITDPATRVLMDRVPGLESAYTKMVDDANNSSINATQAIDETKKALATARQSFIDNADAVGEIGRAARSGAGGIAESISKLGGSLIGGLAPYTEATTKSAENVNAAANTADKATEAMNKVIDGQIKLATDIQQQILTPDVMGKYAQAVGFATGAMIKTIETFSGVKPKEGAAGSATGPGGGADTGGITQWFKDNAKSLIVGASTVAGAAIGGGLVGAATFGTGGIAGGVAGANLGYSFGEVAAGLLGFAGGGVAKGSESGYMAKLHGEELIVPLSGNTLDTSSQGYQDLLNLTGVTSIPKIGETNKSTEGPTTTNNTAMDTFKNLAGSLATLTSVLNPFASMGQALVKSFNTGPIETEQSVMGDNSVVGSISGSISKFLDGDALTAKLVEAASAALLPKPNNQITNQNDLAMVESKQDNMLELNQTMKLLNSKVDDMVDYLRDVATHTRNTADAVQ